MSALAAETRKYVFQFLDSTRFEKIVSGVRRGMSAGIRAHQSWGLATSKAAAASSAATANKRIAILIAHERTGRTCMKPPFCLLIINWHNQGSSVKLRPIITF